MDAEVAWSSRKKDVANKDTTVQPLQVALTHMPGEDTAVYFYAEVDRNSVMALNRELRYKEKNLRSLQQSMEVTGGHINLYINSPGGAVLQGFSAMDTIRASTIPITTIIDGCAASAATLMSVVGKHRVIYKHAPLLIHQLSSIHWGNFEQLKDDMKNSERFMETIRNIYREYTKIPPKALDDMLKHDLWWDAKTCLKYGLVDKII
jgi:ATP-dependent protease ClpP protease subunit